MAAAGAMAMMTMASANSTATAMGEQANQEEMVAGINSEFLKVKANQALKQGEKDLDAFKVKSAKFKGDQLVALAQSGVSVDYGSALNARTETDLLSAEDEGRIKNNAALQAWGFKTESVNALLQGKYKAQGLRNQAQSTLLGGVAKAGAYAYGSMKAPGKTEGGDEGKHKFTGGTISTGSSYDTNEFTA